MGGFQTIDVSLEPGHAGWRLDRALAAAVPTLSRERLKALIRSGAVETQGSAIRDPSAKVKGDEALRLQVPEPKQAENEPQDIPLNIAFEDEHLVEMPVVPGRHAPLLVVVGDVERVGRRPAALNRLGSGRHRPRPRPDTSRPAPWPADRHANPISSPT